MSERSINTNRKKWIWKCAILVTALCITGGAVKVLATGETADSKSQSDTVSSTLTASQQKTFEQIKSTYNVENQTAIKKDLESKKTSQNYTKDHMLIEPNPFGTNVQSLYVYFQTLESVKVSYTVQTEQEGIQDFTLDAENGDYKITHEFQVIGLIPNVENTVLFTLTGTDGTTETKSYTCQMGDLLGTEEVQLERTVEGEETELSNGLYIVFGNDSTSLDFMYYYDNQGVLRGEVPLIEYRSHRLISDENSMYYSISQTQMAQVDALGQVVQVFDLGKYELHHDYVFDNNGNVLILASDTTQNSVEDIIVSLDTSSGEVTEVLDLGDLFDDYKATCQANAEGELDWMHINTLQWISDESIVISSRETSTIIKITDIYELPKIAYMIGSKEFWHGTEYEELLYEQDGSFSLHGGQHTVTYETDETLEEGQYYLYMYNNNIGFSASQPEFDWSSIGLSETTAKDGNTSYYYKYLVDENKDTFSLADSFEVPYSGYVSSAQHIDNNTVINSGFQGIFGEYDENHTLIASFQINVEKFIYRVYKMEL